MSALAELRALDGRFRFMRAPGPWLWLVLVAGALARGFLALFSEGTLDVGVWQTHAREIHERGLLAYYHGGPYVFNHPPPMGLLSSWLLQLGEATGIPFRVLLRLPFALLDGGTTGLLIWLLGSASDAAVRRARYAIGALYWLWPLPIILSSYHGNTDSAVAFFLAGAALCVSRGRAGLAGALLGASLWVKLPGILAAPVLLLALPGWRERLRFGAWLLAVGAAGYVPLLLRDAEIVIRSVFLYSGLRIQTTTGAPIWGLQIFYPQAGELPAGLRPAFRAFVTGYYRLNTVVCLIAILGLAVLRRREQGSERLAQSIGLTFVMLYGLSNFWAFQYFAWSLPFWLISGFGFAIGASLLATSYVFGLYAWLCDSWLLLGSWDFIGKPEWPLAIRLLRDACVLFFLAAALHALYAALRAEISHWRSKSRVG